MNTKLLRALSITALGLALVACGGNTSSADGTSSQAPATSETGAKEIKINATAKQTKDAGDKVIESKRELGTRYGMAGSEGSTNGDVAAEWDVQVAAFEAYTVGKTVATLTGANYQTHYNPSGDTVIPGCSISMGDFTGSLTNTTQTKAFTATADSTVGVSIIVDGLEDNVLSFTIAGAVYSADDKVVEASVNAYQIPLMLDETAESGFAVDTSKKQTMDAGDKVVESKRELGTRYGMAGSEGSTNGDVAAEWDAQADAFAAYAEGKTGAELTGANYVTHYNPNGTTTVPGCSITMSSFAAAVAEAGTLTSATAIAAGDYELGFGSKVYVDGSNVCIAVASYVLDANDAVVASCFDVMQSPIVVE